MANTAPLRIAVIGTGISGMSAAWLLSERHAVTVYECAGRMGGHSNTVTVATAAGPVPVDTGFIVYNPLNYPNLTALFEHLSVPTQAAEMSLSVSMDGGRLEYAGTDLAGLLAQKRNLLRPRFWRMLRDLLRFYREAPRAAESADAQMTLGDYLVAQNYSTAFRDDHLLPMAAAIWSATPAAILAYPFQSFVRFHANHGLLQLRDRPQWRTVIGGARAYVDVLTRRYADRVRLNSAVTAVHRDAKGVRVRDVHGIEQRYDHVVIAAHADQTLAMLADATILERVTLGAFRYTRNIAVLHSDDTLMPKRRAAWSSWNFIGGGAAHRDSVCVSYWMNRLQSIRHDTNFFVTLNPPQPPRTGTLIHSEAYEHPVFDARAIAAQAELWSLQGRGNTWFCSAYFGAGFHEDGLQAGLAVAEALGHVRRPWTVDNESGRIRIGAMPPARDAEMAA